METVTIPKRELEWLLNCSDLQMGDGDTARALAAQWLEGLSALEAINEQQRRLKMAELPISDA